MGSLRLPTFRPRAPALLTALMAGAVHLVGCTSCGDFTCSAHSNADLARFAQDPWCEAIAAYETTLETLDGLQGADKNIDLTFNDELRDISAIDSARDVWLTWSPLEEAVATAAGFDLHAVPLRTAHLGLRWPVPMDEPLDPDEPFAEVLNQVIVEITGDGPTDITLHCVDTGCRARVLIQAAALDEPEIAVGGVQIVILQLAVGPLTSWEFLQGFGVPEQEIRLSAPQDLAIIRAWRAWLDDNGFTGSLATCEDGQECVEVTADGT